jgi:hypothetical protein
MATEAAQDAFAAEGAATSLVTSAGAAAIAESAQNCSTAPGNGNSSTGGAALTVTASPRLNQATVTSIVVLITNTLTGDIVSQIAGIHVGSDRRPKLLSALCRLLDCLVDIVPRGDAATGIDGTLVQQHVDKLKELEQGSDFKNDISSMHLVRAAA